MTLFSSSSWGAVSMAHSPVPACLATYVFWGEGWVHAGSRADSIHKTPCSKPALCCHCYSPWENSLRSLVWAPGSEGEARQIGLRDKEKTEQECLWVVEENITGGHKTWLIKRELSSTPSQGISARAETGRHNILEVWLRNCCTNLPSPGCFPDGGRMKKELSGKSYMIKGRA